MTDFERTLQWLRDLNIHFHFHCYEPECYVYIDIDINKGEMTTPGNVTIRIGKAGKYLGFSIK